MEDLIITVKNVLASVFSDKIGCRDNNLYDGGYYYVELSEDYTKKDFKALGGLSFGQKLRITYNRKTVIASKGDIGTGGHNYPKIDLHINLANALVFNKGLTMFKLKKFKIKLNKINLLL